MNKIRSTFFVIIGKAVVKLLKLTHHDAGNAPGIILQALHKNVCDIFTVDCPVVAVTGTNGKTSVTNFIAHMFEEEGKNIITNPEGNNLDTGVCSLLLKHCTITGKVNADALILETDESHVPVIYKSIKLDSLVVLNFFRDQLDRNGEVETLILKIQKFCETYNGNLFLNADDPNVSRLGLANPKNKNVKYFSVAKYKYATNHVHEAAEGVFCPRCHTALKYEYYQYSHIGKFVCPKCGYGNVEYYARADKADLEEPALYIDGKKYETGGNSIYYMYNMTAVYAVAKYYKIDEKIIRDTLKNFKIDNGRMEEFDYKDSHMILNLSKNPVGANMTIRMLNEHQGEKELLFVLNDNIADGLDVSWIWDINFSIFNNVSRVVTAGTRGYDIAVRIKDSGYEPAKISPHTDIDEAIRDLFSTTTAKYGIANYTALQPTRRAIKKFIDGGEK